MGNLGKITRKILGPLKTKTFGEVADQNAAWGWPDSDRDMKHSSRECYWVHRVNGTFTLTESGGEWTIDIEATFWKFCACLLEKPDIMFLADISDEQTNPDGTGTGSFNTTLESKECGPCDNAEDWENCRGANFCDLKLKKPMGGAGAGSSSPPFHSARRRIHFYCAEATGPAGTGCPNNMKVKCGNCAAQ